ncbi:MAG: PEGA domain-containing protein [Spirochaetes bacterium]|nr:PEGA domain-containing protein [Spirochaetota bacterium]
MKDLLYFREPSFLKIKEMLKKILLLILISSFTNSLWGKNVAVLEFQNNTGHKGLEYLSKSLPDSLSSALSDFKEIKVVERRAIDKILKEKELELSGILEQSSMTRISKITKAEILIMGRYTGDPENIQLSIKAVEVDTSTVVMERMISTTVKDIFDQSHRIGYLIGAILSGKGVGSVSVNSTPHDAKVYIDGTYVGDTPLTEFKVASGSHEIKVVKGGYFDSETTMTVGENGHERWDAFLPEDTVRDRFQIGFGVLYLMLPSEKAITPSSLFNIHFGRSFNRLIISGEFAFGGLGNKTAYDSGFGNEIELEQWYNLYYFAGHINFNLFPRWKYFSPVIGAFAGYGVVYYNRESAATSEDEAERIKEFTSMFNLGPELEFSILPASHFNIFLDIRYIIYPKKILRNEYEGNLFGPRITFEKELGLNLLGIGGGIRVYF